MEGFETIAVFNYPHEVIFLKHRLDQEGIHYFFQNETTLSVAPMYTNAIGGVQLKIHPNDFEAVKQILDELKGSNLNIV